MSQQRSIRTIEATNLEDVSTTPLPPPQKLPTPKTTGIVPFLLLSTGVFFFFMMCSYIEEMTFKAVPGFNYSGFMTVYELFGFAFIALIQRGVSGGTSGMLAPPVAPITSHAMVALFVWISRGLTNLSLEYLNYPTQVIFKSMKLPVVILGSVVMLRKSYDWSEYTSAFLLAVSAALFSLGDVEVSPDFNATGLVIVGLSLVGDAAHSNLQEMVLKNIGAPESEAMLFSNGWGGILALIGTLLSGEFWTALEFFQENQWLWISLGMRTVVVYMGVMCLVGLIKRYGAVAATSVTTIRKILTIIMSFILFPKPFAIKYLFAIVIFMAGILTKMFCQNSTFNFGSKDNLKETPLRKFFPVKYKKSPNEQV